MKENKMETNPFKTYKQALKFLMSEINKKTVLSNYKPSDLDFALLTIFKSKVFRNKFIINGGGE